MNLYETGALITFIILVAAVCLEGGYCLYQAAECFIDDSSEETELKSVFFDTGFEFKDWRKEFICIVGGIIVSALLASIWPLSTVVILVFSFLFGARWVKRVNKKLKKAEDKTQ